MEERFGKDNIIALKVMRVDLGIDKKLNEDFPEIGLRDISVKMC